MEHAEHKTMATRLHQVGRQKLETSAIQAADSIARPDFALFFLIAGVSERLAALATSVLVHGEASSMALAFKSIVSGSGHQADSHAAC